MKEIIAMHGWAGEGNQWSNWIDLFQSSNWIWQSAERGYGNSNPSMPNWTNTFQSKGFIRVAICHSLGSHLIANKVLSHATHIVLINSFSSFLPSGKESRSINVALNGMIQAIGTKKENSMILKFQIKAHKPNKFTEKSTDSTYLNLSDSGRLRLKNDLKVLLNSNSLPLGLTTNAEVLVINSEKDYILPEVSKKKLIKDLTNHLKKAPTVIEIKKEGHTLSKNTVTERVKHWLESNHASELVKASK